MGTPLKPGEAALIRAVALCDASYFLVKERQAELATVTRETAAHRTDAAEMIARAYRSYRLALRLHTQAEARVTRARAKTGVRS